MPNSRRPQEDTRVSDVASTGRTARLPAFGRRPPVCRPVSGSAVPGGRQGPSAPPPQTLRP